MKLTFMLIQVLLISFNVNFPPLILLNGAFISINLNSHYFGSEFSMHFWHSWHLRKRSILSRWRSARISEIFKPLKWADFFADFIRLGKVPLTKFPFRLTSISLSQQVLFPCECPINFLHFKMFTLSFLLIFFISKSFFIMSH